MLDNTREVASLLTYILSTRKRIYFVTHILESKRSVIHVRCLAN